MYDKDFDVPIPGAQVLVVENGQKADTGGQGNYIFGQVPVGTYTLVFTKDGYVRQVIPNVLVTAGALTDVDVSLADEYAELDEFVVEDVLQAGAGSESALLKMRFDSPSLMDSVGSELMSRAGASDAAAALRLVAGATVTDGKFAVVRGLPDRYISSQMNGVRLPSADENKRAVELDQFPAAVIESIQVAKTFTPDQQGDASGGAVNVRLKGIPDESSFQVKMQGSYNTQSTGRNDFVTYDGGGVNFWGRDNGSRDVQYNRLGESWKGAVGTTDGSSPIDYKWAVSGGTKLDLGNSVKVGGFAGVFYERSSFLDRHERQDYYWMLAPGTGLVPQTFEGIPAQGDFKTGLYDVAQGKETVRWGGIGSFGIESEHHALSFTYLYTRVADDVATLSIDTRGKAYFFPGYDVNDPKGDGNHPDQLLAAPYLRTETLKYTERTTRTAQLSGRHVFPIEDVGIEDKVKFEAPEFDWVISNNFAGLNEPDKRQFGAFWVPPSFHKGVPPFTNDFVSDPAWNQLKPLQEFTLGNLQRIWEQIYEDSEQYSGNLKLPFEQWSQNKGYAKFGIFDDRVHRTFNQNTFSNFNDSSGFVSDFSQPWSEFFPYQDHPITDSKFDIDYKGEQHIGALYSMLDLPLSSYVRVIGGARFESSNVSVVMQPEGFATWFPPGASVPVALRPGDADVDLTQRDVLPSAEVVVTPLSQLTLRGAYSQTVAHQTFKEITPILQQEYLGAPIFIGNPFLQMSSLKNYDLRADYAPYDGGLVSFSWFRKDVKDPIEYVQKDVSFTYTTAENYPEGFLTGYEFEARQNLGRFWDPCEGWSVGANATFINSQVTLPPDEAAAFEAPNIQAPMPTRDMTNAPDHLYNLYTTYDIVSTGTQFGVFYTVQGDTLIQGAAANNNTFIPSVYAKAYGTLNLSVSQDLSKRVKMQIQAKNVLDPKIETVYRSKYIGGDQTASTYRKGVELSISLTATF